MNTDIEQTIVVTVNGPYIVSGSVPVGIQTIAANEGDESWEWEAGRTFVTKDVCALCRCGASSHAPYCDGTHAKIAFDGTETAARQSYDAQKTIIEGPGMVLDDARAFCAVARFCDAVTDSWDLVAQADSPDKHELLKHQVMRCPSGRLVVRERGTQAAIEPVFEPSIGVVEDPLESCSGPLWVRGGIAVQSQDGYEYERRNRVTLCRCGQSKNKPFCDGTHTEIKFHDGIVAGPAEPSPHATPE